jgi:hypothetical protein
MKNKSLFTSIIFIIVLAVGLRLDYSMHGISTSIESTIITVIALIIASYISSSIKIADPWDKAVVLRIGKFYSLKGLGLFFIIPVLDTIPSD